MFAEALEARKQRRTPRDYWIFLYLAFFGVAINQVCFTIGLRYTSVSHSAVIVGMGPILFSVNPLTPPAIDSPSSLR